MVDVSDSGAVPSEDPKGTLTALVRRSLGPFLALNGLFFYFFYDTLNLNFNILAASHLAERLSPYIAPTPVLSGYQLLPLDQLSYYAYVGSGFNPWAPVFLLKALAVGATYAGALLCYRIAVRRRLPSARKLFYAFAFNPFFLFINDIWVETDVLIIVLILAGYYLLREPSTRSAAGEVPRLALGTLVIVVAALGYFAPAIIIPALVLYAGPRALQVRAAVWFAALGAIFAAPILLFHLDSGAALQLATVGGVNVYSVLNLFSSAPVTVSAQVQQLALGAAAAMAVGVPVLFRRWRIAEPIALWVVFVAATTLAFTYVQGDNFVLFLGFLFLALLYIPGTPVTYLRIVALQLFLLPMFYVIEMWNGPQLTAGLFYWSFPTLHLSVSELQPLGGKPVWLVALGLYVGAVLATTAYLIREGLRARAGNPVPEPRPQTSPALPKRGWQRVPWAVLAVFLLVGGTPLLAAALDVSTTSISYANAFPSQIYVPSDLAIRGAYLMPSPTTYIVDPAAGRLTFTKGCPPVGLGARLSLLHFETNFIVGLPDPGPLAVGTPVPFLNTTGLVAGFASEIELPSSALPLSPDRVVNAIPALVNSTVFWNSTPAYVSASNTSLAYGTTAAALTGKDLVFGEVPTSSNTGRIRLWSLFDGTHRWEADINGSLLVLGQSTGGGPWTTVSVPYGALSGSWHLAGVSVDPVNQSVTAILDANRLTVAGGWTGVGSANFSMGTPPWNGPPLVNDSRLVGLVTVPYPLPFNSFRSVVASYIGGPGDPKVIPAGLGATATVSYVRTAVGTALVVNGVPHPVVAPDQYILLGKLSSSGATVAFTFHRMVLATVIPQHSLLWVVADFTLLLPGVTAAWFLQVRRRERGRAEPGR
ncbi:MAG: hypothetical protein L3K14_00040 [Thermoplasmata archaeon]|nr:hypothetical protein [Thermoplasmata archaeon]